MKPVTEWDEEYILSLPHGEFDWLEIKGRRAIDLTLPSVKESDALEMLAKEISAFANSGGGQLVFGLANPSGTKNWVIDDGGISNSVKGRSDTREWLEDIIPNLVEFPLTKFDVYSTLPHDSTSQIQPGRALYIIDVADSPHAPHQSTYDKKYYARVAGKSRPLSHRMILDIIGRRQYPKIELKFEIEKKFIKGKPLGISPFNYDPFGNSHPEKDTNKYTLEIRARNTGKIYAQYVGAFIYIPPEILQSLDVKISKANSFEKIDGQDYIRYYEEFDSCILAFLV